MDFRRRDLLRAPQLMALLLVTLAVAALAAIEAEGDVGVHRATAERALGDYLAVIGRDAVSATVGAVAAELTTVLAPAAGARAGSPYDPLPPPDALAGPLATLRPDAFACADGAPLLVRLDLRDGALATAGGAAPTPAVARWLRDTLSGTVARGDAHAAVAGTMPIGVLFGRGAAAGRAVAYGVKRAPFDAPIAVYALLTCAEAFGAPLVARAERVPAVAALAADSMLVLASGDDAAVDRPLGTSSLTPLGTPVAAARLGGLVVRATPGPGAARRLVVRPGSRPRIVLLGVLAAATAALVLVALAQLGREQDLVRLRADFTSSVSHELRTPLSQILLYGETLALGRARGDADRRAAAETIVREARRLMGMVENVLYVARAERRANAGRADAVPLAPLAADVVAGFAPLAAAAGATVTVDVPAALTAVVDASALRQALLNLLDNAVRYGPAGQRVRVGGARADGAVRLWVDDDGPGVPPRDRERIWTPFVRLSRDRVTRTGSGLGLAVVRDVVARYDGRAWVEDVPAGARGARFVIELPAGVPNVMEDVA